MNPSNVALSGYCERVSSDFWAEPFNAWSNGAFIVAAVAACMLQRREGLRDWVVMGLTALVFAIGIGSFLFHTMPQRWTLLADVIPIQLFAFLYFGATLRRFFRFGLIASTIGTLAFLTATFGVLAVAGPLLPPALRGSAGYGSFLLALFGVAFALWRSGGDSATARILSLAGGVFALSLTLRSFDGPACDVVPTGLHVYWHLLNAVVLYLLLRAAILRRNAA